MRKSIAAEYFSLCIALVAAAMICMAALLINFSFSTYQSEKKTFLCSVSSEARAQAMILLDNEQEDTFDTLKKKFLNLSARTGANFLLLNNSGDVLVCSEASPCSLQGRVLDKDSINFSAPDGNFAMDTRNGFFDEASLSVLFKLEAGGSIYHFIAYTSAESLFDYLLNVIVLFFGVFALIMVIVYPLLKYTINRILNPIKEMTLAAKRFGEGDFSEKLNISDSNEMGYLANSLNDMASSLEAIEENRKSFISNVSHELRTPMTTIGGFVDGILDGTIPKEQHKQYLKTVSEEINRLARLVRSMLNISKYEAGELELQTEQFDITALTIKTVLLFEKRIEGKNIDIRGLDTEKLMVKADADLAQQVIYNLTENAVKFVNFGGYISYAFRREGNMVYVAIRNSGEGLKKNEINKVFDRFYKTDESRGKDKSGVGLGLSIVRSIIKLHEGTVLVRSKPNEYTEFEFSLPLAEN